MDSDNLYNVYYLKSIISSKQFDRNNIEVKSLIKFRDC